MNKLYYKSIRYVIEYTIKKDGIHAVRNRGFYPCNFSIYMKQQALPAWFCPWYGTFSSSPQAGKCTKRQTSRAGSQSFPSIILIPVISSPGYENLLDLHPLHRSWRGSALPAGFSRFPGGHGADDCPAVQAFKSLRPRRGLPPSGFSSSGLFSF